MMAAPIPDNEGISYTGRKIDPTGKVGYLTTLPYKKMVAVDEKVAYSFSAGTYICNNIFYRLQSYLEQTKSNSLGGFIHVPFSEKKGSDPFIPLADQIAIITNIVKVAGE